ncbi:MAG: DUF4097 family beta strand repeat-containing protein [Gemmatimonadota bacterium]
MRRAFPSRLAALALVLLGAATAVRAQATQPAPMQPVPAHLRGRHVSPTVSMRIYVPAGRLIIRTWDRDSIAVTGTHDAASSMFGGGDLGHVKFGVEPLRTGDTRLASADLHVTVPRRARLWLKATVAMIDVTGSAGELEVYAVGGSITVRQASGVISIESIDAPVQVDSVRGDLRVRGGKAPVVVRDATGTASITTVSGSVTLTGRVPESRVETIGGDVTLDATQLAGVTTEVQTHAGAIRIAASAKARPLLELSSRTGRVTTPAPAGAAANGRVLARSFRGTISVTPPQPLNSKAH